MITEKQIIGLLNNWDILNIESHFIYYYIKFKKIDYSKSRLLNDYFKNFTLNKSLFNSLQTFELSTIKHLENSLELIIPNDDRKLNGAFFTPNYIVDFIINTIKPQENEKNLDPSCGRGAFLVGLVNYYKTTYNKSIKRTIQENLFGADLMTYNIKRTKLILSIFALENNEIIENDDFNLIVQDSIRADWKSIFSQSKGFDNIIGNPPYVKFQDLSEENRNFLSKNYKTIKNGTFNLYFAFFELGFNLLSKNGKLGYITPNNYFTSLAGQPLRLFFQSKQCIYRIVDFKSKKVFNAQTYTAITFLDKKDNSELLYDKIPDNLEPNQFLKNVNGSPNKLSDLNPKKWRLLKKTEQQNIKNIETLGQPIGQLFNIAVGVATLKDEIYFIDTQDNTNDYYVKIHNDKKYLIEKDITKTIYKISDFKKQKDVIHNKRRIIFPYKTKKGNAVALTENEIKEKFPKTYEYFLAVRAELEKRDKGKKV
ncbi:MAG: N-6 DNA methylase, partial [Bacteroidota bacterium]|nr:N-6 DNA methylase [Bacteroidota bacterium]